MKYVALTTLIAVAMGVSSVSLPPLRIFPQRAVAKDRVKDEPQDIGVRVQTLEEERTQDRKDHDSLENRVEVIEARLDQPEPNPQPTPQPQPTPPVPAPSTLLELSLPAEFDGDVGDPIAIKPSTNAKHVRWKVLDRGLKLFPANMLSDPTATVVWSQHPGQYRLMAYASLNDVIGDVETTIVVTGTAPQPPPAPIPNPQPAPLPVPVPPAPLPVPPPAPVVTQLSNLWVVIIYDFSSQTEAISRVINDPQFRLSLRNQGVQLKLIDRSDKAADAYYEVLNSNTSLQYPKGIPCVVLMDAGQPVAGGKIKWINKGPGEAHLPASVADFKVLINKYVGGALR